MLVYGSLLIIDLADPYSTYHNYHFWLAKVLIRVLTAQLPTNRDAEKAVESTAVEVATEADKEIEVGKYYVTLISEGKYNTWYITSCENRNGNGTFQMDHLIRVQKGNDLTWKLEASKQTRNS